MLEYIKHEYHMGGWPLIPIAIIATISGVIIAERALTLYVTAKEDRNGLLSEISKRIVSGDISGATSWLQKQKKGPLHNIIAAGLLKINQPEKEIQATLDEASLKEVPKLEKNTGYLAVFSNATTLVGLLGTIIGMIHCFAAVAHVDPAEKATVLSGGISEAMTCTKWGLGTAIVILIIYAILQAKTQHLIDDINATVVTVLNSALAAKSSMKGGEAKAR